MVGMVEPLRLPYHDPSNVQAVLHVSTLMTHTQVTRHDMTQDHIDKFIIQDIELNVLLG